VWTVLRTAAGWRLVRHAPDGPTASVTIPESIAWRLFTKGIGRPEAERLIRIDGDRRLGAHTLGAVAIVG